MRRLVESTFVTLGGGCPRASGPGPASGITVLTLVPRAPGSAVS